MGFYGGAAISTWYESMLSAVVLEIINERLISKYDKTSNSNTRCQKSRTYKDISRRPFGVGW